MCLASLFRIARTTPHLDDCAVVDDLLSCGKSVIPHTSPRRGSGLDDNEVWPRISQKHKQQEIAAWDSMDIQGHRARATKCWKKDYKCGGKVVPKLRVASCAKTGVVEKRLPIGDRFREEEQTSVPHCYGDDTLFACSPWPFFVTMSRNHMFWKHFVVDLFFWPLRNHMTRPHCLPHDANHMFTTVGTRSCRLKTHSPAWDEEETRWQEARRDRGISDVSSEDMQNTSR